MACPDAFAFATPAAGTQLMPGELHFFTLPVDLSLVDPLILHVEMAVQYGTGDMYLSVGNPFPQLATDGFRAGAQSADATGERCVSNRASTRCSVVPSRSSFRQQRRRNAACRL